MKKSPTQAREVNVEITSVEWSPAFHYGYNSVVLPRVRRTAGVLDLIQGIETVALVAIVLAVAIASLIWRASSTRPRPSFLRAASNMVAVIISKPSLHVASTKPTTARILVSTYSAFSIAFVCLFQGILIDNMTNIRFSPTIETLQEVDDLNFEIVAPNAIYARAFGRSDSPLLNRLNAKVKTRGEFKQHDVLEWLSKQQEIAVVMTHISFLLQAPYVSDGKQSVYEVQENPSFYFLGYILPIGSPFVERLRDLCGRLLQSGLIKHWYDKSIEGDLTTDRRTLRSEGRLPSEHRRPHHTVITIKLKDFYSIFIMMLCSYTLSVLIFISDILIKKWWTPYRRRGIAGTSSTKQ